MKKLFSVILCVALVAAIFAGCSGNKKEKYSDETLIIGYTEEMEPMLKLNENGKPAGFSVDLWKAIFDGVKGDCKRYRFEKVEEGYELEKDGGFFDSKDKEYSAGLLMGPVTMNKGTFNKDYSFTDPIITNRIIALTAKNSDRNGFTELKDARVVAVSDIAAEELNSHSSIASVCKSITQQNDITKALALLDSGKADVVVTDEFSFMPTGKEKDYKIFEQELDRIDYVIACAKYSGWKDSINQAIYELKNEEYGKGDEFTPIVEKYFGYNASQFNYEPSKTK